MITTTRISGDQPSDRNINRSPTGLPARYISAPLQSAIDAGRVRISGDHPRWCAVCGTQRSTTRGVFDAHKRPGAKANDPDCPNSGQKVNKVEQAT